MDEPKILAGVGCDAKECKYNMSGSLCSAPSIKVVGDDAKTTTTNQIVLGNPNQTVYIPGKLIVGQQSFFGSDLGAGACGVAGTWGNGGVRAFIADYHDGFDVVNEPRAGDGYQGAYDLLRIYSDRRLKNVGEKFTAGVNELSKLEFFYYTFKKDEAKTPHVGVIAQDLQKVFPDAVTKGDDGFLRIRWEDMFYAAINAIKELNTKIIEIAQNLTKTDSKIEEQAKIIEAQQKNIEKQQEIIDNQQKTIEEQQKNINEINTQYSELVKQNKELIHRVERIEKKI